MSNANHPRYRTIEAQDGFLPAPATKLIITQHLKAARAGPCWAWIIVAAFYDSDSNVLWSTEVFVGQLDTDSEFENEESDRESVGTISEFEQSDTESDSLPYSYTSHRNIHQVENLNLLTHTYQPHISQPHRTSPVWYGTAPLITPPTAWDPTRQGPVPGFWQATFDPHSRRWVNTWQPFC